MTLLDTRPFVKRAAQPITIAYTHGAANNTSGAAHTYSAVGFGTADAARRIVIGEFHYANPDSTISSATIGGITATITSATVKINDGAWRTTFIVAAVPTGTSGTVVITKSGSSVRSVIDVWSMTNAGSDTPTDFKTDHDHDTVCSNTITVPANGCCMAICAGTGNGGSYRTITWTNATERSDRATVSDTGQSSADRTTSGSVTITATASSSWNNSLDGDILLAAWSPA